MRKRLVAFCLAIVLGVSSVFAVYAEPIASDEVIANAKWSIVNKLKSLGSSLDNNAYGQYGVFYNLYYLVQYAGYLDLMLTADDLGFSQTEKDVYLQMYCELTELFNTKHGAEEDGTIPLKVEEPMRSSESEVKKSIEALVEVDVPEYCVQYLEVLAEGDGELDEYQQEISKINQILEFMSQFKDYCASMLPSVEGEDGRLEGLAGYSQLKAKLTANEDALAVLNEGKDVSSQIVDVLGNVSYRDANTYIEQLANVTLNSGAGKDAYGTELWKNTGTSSGFQLTDTYLAMLATSAVYTPFVSKVGDERFMSALETLAGTDSAQKVTRLYDEIKDYRKPLFMVESKKLISSDETVLKGNGGRKYSGDATKIRLEDLLEYAGSKKEIALLTVKGDLKVNPEDGNSYAFFMEGGPSKYLNTSTQQGLNVQSSGEVTTDALNEDANNLANSVYIADGTTVSTVHWTDVVFELGDSSLGGSMNRLLLTNITNDLRNQKELETLGRSYLYVNVFGDIVLDDNTVVIPGAANASLYGNIYNPFTVAFYNSYPAMKIHEEKVSFYDPNAVGKYVLRLYTKTLLEKIASEISQFDDDMITNTVAMYLVQGDGDIAISKGVVGSKLISKFYNANQGEMEALHFVNKDYGWVDETLSTLTKMNNSSLFAYFDTISAENLTVLPYDQGLDDGFVGASVIAKNMLYSYTNTKSGLTNTSNGMLKENFIFENLILEVLNGTPFASSYQKSTAANEVELEPYGFWGKLLVGMANGLLEVANVDGLLGLKNRYESSLFGKVFFGISEYSFFICILLGFVFLANFTRQRFNLTYTVGMTAFAVALVYAFLNIFPVYVPYAFNAVVNNTGKNLAYDITLVGAEVYEDAYGNAQEVDKDGRFKETIGSVNLYKLSQAGAEELAANLAVDKSRFMNGNVYILDEQSGIYVEGDTIKVSLDSLFYGNPILGTYETTADGQLYQLKAYKEYSSVVDYYMPYYQMVDGFVGTLNDMLSAYRIPRHTVQYLDGLSKDSFLVYSYANSIPFLSPGDLDVDNVLQPDEAEILKSKFGDMYDFMNVRQLLENPSEAMKQTLWYRTLSQNGYFLNTEESAEKREDLIYYVNYHTREFIIQLDPQLGLISDENLIKVIGLHATMLFNQRASEYGNWLYPVMLNYPEFQLKDVYRVSLSDDTRKFAEANLDVVDYVYTEKGSFGVLGLLVDAMLGWAIAFVVPNVIMFLYLALMLLLLYRTLTSMPLSPLVKGYFKSSLLFFLVYALFTTVTANVSSLLLLFLVYVVTAMLLVGIVSAILGNLTELGNSGLENYWKRFSSWMRKGNFRIGQMGWNRGGGHGNVTVNNYGMNYSVDGSQMDGGWRMPKIRHKAKSSVVRHEDPSPASWYDEDDWLNGR